MNGKIKWFNPTKGYGFIVVEGREDVFLHVSALEKANISELTEGSDITFDIGENRGKETAINVTTSVKVNQINPNVLGNEYDN